MTTTTRRMQRWSGCVCGSAILAAVLVALATRPAAAVAEDAMLNQCSELKAQEHLDLKEVKCVVAYTWSLVSRLFYSSSFSSSVSLLVNSVGGALSADVCSYTRSAR